MIEDSRHGWESGRMEPGSEHVSERDLERPADSAETGDSPALPNTPNPASASVAPATGAISHDTPATVPVLSAGCGGPEEASSAPSRRPVPVSAALLTAAPTSAQPMAHDGT